MTGRRARLSTLLRGAGIETTDAVGSDPVINGTALDSRKIEQGGLFFALRGLEADGLDFVPDAVNRGARAIVSSRPRPDWLASEIAWVEVDQPRRVAGLHGKALSGPALCRRTILHNVRIVVWRQSHLRCLRGNLNRKRREECSQAEHRGE